MDSLTRVNKRRATLDDWLKPTKGKQQKISTLTEAPIVLVDDGKSDSLDKHTTEQCQSVTTSGVPSSVPTSNAFTSSVFRSSALVLDRLYKILAGDTARGFDKFTKRYPLHHLRDIIFKSLEQPVLGVLKDNDYCNKQRLLSIGGDPTRYDGPGWYGDILTDDNDSFWFKTYIGQAEYVKRRVSYHCRPSVLEKNTALHYQLLRPSERKFNYVLLGKLPLLSGDSIDTDLLDVIEMYLALLFQALPPKTLRKYLPEGTGLRQPERGCMVANPLDQHHDDQAARRSACQLRDSTDPEVRNHYKDACEHLKKVAYVPTMQHMRKKSKKQQLFRDPSNEFEAIVYIRCNTCKADVSIKRDPLPIYDKASGAYLVRQQSCFNCPVPGAKKVTDASTNQLCFTLLMDVRL